MQKAIIIIRILVGWVFIAGGYLKFAVPEELGVGRLTCRGSVHLSPGAKVLASFTTESPQVISVAGYSRSTPTAADLRRHRPRFQVRKIEI